MVWSKQRARCFVCIYCEIVFTVCRYGFKLMLYGCVVSVCCVSFVFFDVVCDELNDCVWNVCL